MITIVITIERKEAKKVYQKWIKEVIPNMKHLRSYTKNKAKKIKSNNFIGSNKEKSNIAIMILNRLTNFILGAPIIFLWSLQCTDYGLRFLSTKDIL